MKHKFSPLQLIEEKCRFTGQLGVGCRHFRRLLRRFFRFLAKDHARCRSRYATRGIAPTFPSQKGVTNRRQCNGSYESWNRLESFPKFCKLTHRSTEFSDFTQNSFSNSDTSAKSRGPTSAKPSWLFSLPLFVVTMTILPAARERGSGPRALETGADADACVLTRTLGAEGRWTALQDAKAKIWRTPGPSPVARACEKDALVWYPRVKNRNDQPRSPRARRG